MDISHCSRIVILGTTGSGKTTLAKRLSHVLQIPAVELDAFRHGPNWTETPDQVFRQQVADSLNRESWIVDGNYGVARDLIWPRATTLIWLDYSMTRGIMRTRLWNDNREDLWRHLLTKDSLFLWALQSHWSRRKSLAADVSSPEYSHINVLRFRSARETQQWFERIKRQL